jgi:glutathione synthase/RimK-type ligase-like ATP-grasp enzyme
MILLLTHSRDFYTIDGVEHHLQRLGADYRRLNTDHFPSQFRLSVGPGGTVWLEAGDQQLDLTPAKACWARRLWPGVVPPEAPLACAQQSRAFFLEAMGQLDQAYWINPLLDAEAAESKLWQLSLAAQLKMRVPATLVTSSPTEARAFAENFPQGVITKLLLPTVQSMEGHPDFAYTTKVEPDHWDQLEVIRWMPQIFQPCLPRRREFRVIVVGQDLYVGALRVDNPDLVDWRAGREDDGLHWEVAQLSDSLRNKVLGMMSRLGLVYAALDFLEVEADQEPYFLEINQAGEWGWLERDLGLPIAERLARALVEHR